MATHFCKKITVWENVISCFLFLEIASCGGGEGFGGANGGGLVYTQSYSYA